MGKVEDLVQELDSCWADRGTYVEGYGKKKYRYGLSYRGKTLKEVMDELEEALKKM